MKKCLGVKKKEQDISKVLHTLWATKTIKEKSGNKLENLKKKHEDKFRS